MFGNRKVPLSGNVGGERDLAVYVRLRGKIPRTPPSGQSAIEPSVPRAAYRVTACYTHDVQTRPVCREEVETITGFRLPGEGDNRNQI